MQNNLREHLFREAAEFLRAELLACRISINDARLQCNELSDAIGDEALPQTELFATRYLRNFDC